jgi:hypothetical protein
MRYLPIYPSPQPTSRIMDLGVTHSDISSALFLAKPVILLSSLYSS